MEDVEGISDAALFGPGHLEWGPVGRLSDAAIAHRQDVRRQHMGSMMGAWAELEGLGGAEYPEPQVSAARVIAGELGRDEAEALAALAAKALARHDQLDRKYGNDLDDGAVIRFTRTAFRGHRTFSYAAIRAAGYWYLTGNQSPQRLTWTDLIQLLDGWGVGSIELMRPTTLADLADEDAADDYPDRSM